MQRTGARDFCLAKDGTGVDALAQKKNQKQKKKAHPNTPNTHDGSRVWGLGFRVEGLGLRIFGVEGLRLSGFVFGVGGGVRKVSIPSWLPRKMQPEPCLGLT